MAIKKNITKKTIIYSAVFAALSIMGHFLCGISAVNAALFILLYAAAANLDIQFDAKYNCFLTIGFIGAGSVFTTWLVQYILLAEDLREKMSGQTFFLNVCCSLVVYLIALVLCANRLGMACIAAHTMLMLFAAANYFVYNFRGNEIVFADIKTIFTGLSVASHYRYSLNAQAMNAILLSVVFAAGAIHLKARCRHAWLTRFVCFSCMIFFSLYVVGKAENKITETWEQKGSYRNGYLLNFLLSIRDSFVEKPDNYSDELIEGMEADYKKSSRKPSKEKPAIIVIMNESFADFDVFGNLETNQPVTPFWDSLSQNTVKGYALASVYGAKTPNSEWEFLTGNSMAYLPPGSVPYQQYVEEENAYSLVDTLKSQDYTCVAMHPYYETGWSRDTVYPKFGFDEMYFLDDFRQDHLMRGYVSDAAMYEKIIERYEAGKEKENLFLMGITMQNHGGYRDFYEDFATDVYGTNVFYQDVNQYLSLLHQTDLAAQNLISYFSNVDEPVIICFFGDHQPSLTPYFYRDLTGKGLSGLTLSELERLYTVPFFIWTNYESESKAVRRTSLNFLSTMLLERANLPLPAYNRFLSDLRKKVPAMNARGYYSRRLKRFVHYGEGLMEDEIWLMKYQNLQYNGLFGDKKSGVFFGREHE